MPQDPFIIATKTASSEVHIFDYKNHPAEPRIGGTSNPDLRLMGHCSEGFGLSWSTINRGSLLSGSDDSKICLWDIDQAPLNKGALDALQTFEFHEGAVEDVAWHLKHRHLFGSCGEDQYLCIYDLRSRCTRPTQRIAHQRAVNCLSFNPFNEWLVATGSDDTTVKSYDLRRLARPLHSFDYHLGLVLQVDWSPHSEHILSSSCEGRKVLIWDPNRIGMEQSEEEEGYGPPEMVYTHGGHLDRVVDFSWNPSEDRMIASVSADNTLQVWKMAGHVYNDYF
ncbi:histone-binding protein MSI1-like [Bidens hawaiensis]|uniref:histone-binding protein MSI1-like n=1 Tax=Bidens hawaiensis TaxID=980011 RepID=UPI004049B136